MPSSANNASIRLRGGSELGEPTPPHHALAISPTNRDTRPDADEARLLPRYRGNQSSFLERRRLQREQAAALLHAVATDPDTPLPLRDILTKPGDPRQLRGIPAIGRGVTGALYDEDPVRALEHKERRAA